jgi:hypothetical protein
MSSCRMAGPIGLPVAESSLCQRLTERIDANR